MIAGPGRSGTTFMWKLLRELRYETGDAPEFFQNRKAEAKKGNIPYVVKGTASLCYNLPTYIDQYDLHVDHVIVALRDLENNVKSKAKTQSKSRKFRHVPRPELRETLRSRIPQSIGSLLLHLLEGEHPYTIIMYPKSALDVEYCYEKVTDAMGEISHDEFVRAWNRTVQPKLIRHRQ